MSIQSTVQRLSSQSSCLRFVSSSFFFLSINRPNSFPWKLLLSVVHLIVKSCGLNASPHQKAASPHLVPCRPSAPRRSCCGAEPQPQNIPSVHICPPSLLYNTKLQHGDPHTHWPLCFLSDARCDTVWKSLRSC